MLDKERLDMLHSTRLSEIAKENLAEFSNFLANMYSFQFDIFRFDEICNQNSMHYFTYELFTKYNFFSFIDQNVFKLFIGQIQSGYSRSVPYHNDLHGLDVLQTCLTIIVNGNLATVNLY